MRKRYVVLHYLGPDNHKTNEQELLSEINVVPLVDVMLVLLIIFMLTAPLSLTAIKVNLPTTKSTQQKVDKSPIILSVNSEGRYFLGKTEIKKRKLVRKLKAMFEHKEQKILYIHADKNIRYGAVISAMGAAKSAGIMKISMMAKSSKTGLT